MYTQRTPPGPAAGGPLLKKGKLDSTTTTSTDSMSLDDAVKLFMEQFSETKTMLGAVRDEINKKIDTVKSDLEGKLNAVSKEISTLRSDCAAKFELTDGAVDALNVQVNTVAHAVNNLEGRNDLIVSNVPFLEGEDLESYFKAMLKQFGLNASTTPLADIRRLFSRSSNGNDRSLIRIQFALTSARDDFFAAYLGKRDLQLRHLGIDSDRRIYVNESLCAAARKVKSAAVRLKKNGKLSSVYTKRGTVQVKVAPGDAAVAVLSEEQLRQISS